MREVAAFCSGFNPVQNAAIHYLSSNLAFAVSAAIALAAAFLVDQRVAAAARTEVAGHIQVAQAERTAIFGKDAVAVAAMRRLITCFRVLFMPGRGFLSMFWLGFQHLHVHLQDASDRIGQ